MINLQFSRGSDFGAKAIQWYEHGSWSHVDVVLDDGQLFGARLDGGVKSRPADYLGDAPTLRVALNVNEGVKEMFDSFLKSQDGKPYDKEAIVAFVYGGDLQERDWRNSSDWFCSELIAAGLEVCGFFPSPLANATNKITPADLLLAISARVPVPQPQLTAEAT